jgi:cysteine synthase B
MPEDSSAERVQTMRAFGAKVTLTPREAAMEGAIDYARSEAARGNALLLDQFSNPDNPAAHERSTAPEIHRDTGGKLTHFVSAMGTTGTIMGCAAYFRRAAPQVKIVGVHPAEGARIPGIRAWSTKYRPRIYQPERLDRILRVSEQDAIATARRLARVEGIFAGVSSGGAVWAALKLAAELEHGEIVCIICDRGSRYLSTGLFEE